MRQEVSAAYQSAQPAGNRLHSIPRKEPLFMPLRTPEAVAAYLRRQWDESIHYQYKIAVVQLNDELQPLGVEFFYLHNNELLPCRLQYRNIAASGTAYVYVGINSPTAEHGKNMGLSMPHAQLMNRIAVNLFEFDISNIGFLIVDPYSEVYMPTESELLSFHGE